MIFQCDGGPGGRRKRDESYSEDEEEEETSSTSVENSENEDEEEGEDEEEEEEDEEDSGEEDTESESNEDDKEDDLVNRRVTRKSGPIPSTSKQKQNLLQKVRQTRQKTREAMPTKRLLRSRNKSPVAGSGPKVSQVFKCQNCKKEFNNKVSLSRHTGWCKQKVIKERSPRKKKSETENGTETPKIAPPIIPIPIPPIPVMEAAVKVVGPRGRGRGRPRKNQQMPLEFKPTRANRHDVMQHHYSKETMTGVLGTLAMLEEEFSQQKSPESSPGVMDTSSEEDYEQKEFAANAHQLISHRSSSASIDVVNPDPPEGPVTCPQCKMTYRTVQGFQNHLPSCTPFSSDEEEDDLDVVNQTVVEAPQTLVPEYSIGPSWTEHQTIQETLIAAPAPLEEPATESSEEASSSSDDGEVEESVPKPSTTKPLQQPFVLTPPVQSSPLRYQEISIAPTGIGKSPLKIFLPPDNTPQVINSSGLTLERLQASPATLSPKVLTLASTGQSQHRNGPSPLTTAHHNESPVQQPSPSHPPPPPVFHPSPVVVRTTPATTPTPLIPPTPAPLPGPTPTENSHPLPSVPTIAAQTLLRLPSTQIASPSPTPSSKVPASSASTSIPLLQQLQAGGNPPTYTQAQLMPGTVLHNSIMQVPQQISTTTGEAYHLNHQQGSTQSVGHFPGAQYPLGLPPNIQTSIAAAQSAYRIQNGVPGMHTSLQPGHLPTSGIFLGGSNAQLQQQLQMAAMAQAQMLQQRLQGPTPQAPNFPHQVPGQQMSQLSTSQGGVSASGQAQPIFSLGNGAIGPYGIPQVSNNQAQHSAFATNPNAQFQQISSQVPNSSLSFPSMVPQQHQQQLSHSATGLPGQQISQPHQLSGPTNGTLSNPIANPSQFSTLPQSQIAQYSFFQQGKLPDNLNQTSTLPHQAVINGQQQLSGHPNGLSFQIQQLQQQQHQTATGQMSLAMQLQQHQLQQSNMAQPIFQHAAASSHAGQAPQGNAIAQPHAFVPQPQQPLANGQVSPAQQPSARHQVAAVQSPQPPSSNLNGHHGQVELNLQQQAQLQQQQQQFLALQQQQQLQIQQQSGDLTRPQSQQQQPQMHTQAMQAVMVNGTLQWIKATQLPTQSQTQQQQPSFQQQQQQGQVSTSTECPTHPAPTQQQTPAPSPQQPQQATPQVIQQLAQVTDSAGNTYIIIAPTQPQQNGTNPLLSLIPGLQQALPLQQQSPVQKASTINCTASANGNAVSHSPGSSASPGNAFHSVGRSAPCPCASCKEKTVESARTASALEKYKKVLPYPSPNDSTTQLKPIAPAPKQPISIRPAIPKQPKIVRVQAATAAAPSPRPLVQMTLTHPQMGQPSQQPPGSQIKIVPVPQQPVGLVGAPGCNNASISSPNIAVVRPMENPLQRLSDQISQIESTFQSPPAPVTSQTPPLPPQTVVVAQASPPPRLTLVTSSPPARSIPVSSGSPSQQFTHVLTFDPPPVTTVSTEVPNSPQVESESTVLNINIPMPRLGLVDHGIPTVTPSPVSSPRISSPSSSIQSISSPATPLRNNTTNNTVSSGVKRKILQVSPSSSGGGGPSAKSIKLSLHKKENADTYSITKIEGDSHKPEGSFKSLKIKGKIMAGPQKDTATNVVVVPSIRIVANPDPDQNETIAEDSQGLSPRENDMSTHFGGDNNNNAYGARGNLRLVSKKMSA